MLTEPSAQNVPLRPDHVTWFRLDEHLIDLTGRLIASTTGTITFTTGRLFNSSQLLMRLGNFPHLLNCS